MFKAVTLDSKASVVSVADPAIDQNESDLEAWKREMTEDPYSWKKYVKPQGGQPLTVFHIGTIDASELTRIESDAGMGIGTIDPRPNQLYWSCFLLGIRGIDNPPVTDSAKDIPTVVRHGVSFVNPAWLNETFSRGLRMVGVGIGQHIYNFNQMTEDDVKK